ncbi:acyl-CoA thioesterase domain-containing protein [Nocardiopsis gilva]|uniref:acyl-CoA thioesterase domain-containing protein n=1 Tax=Nocardiopsis gilva TaxID=280236 RepID=UPI00373AF574
MVGSRALEAKAQHAGPPSALLPTQMLNDHHRPDFRPARVAFELLGQIPVDDLTVRTSVEHSTHRTDLLSGTLLHHDRAVELARMWRYKAVAGALDRLREPFGPPGMGRLPGGVGAAAPLRRHRPARGAPRGPVHLTPPLRGGPQRRREPGPPRARRRGVLARLNGRTGGRAPRSAKPGTSDPRDRGRARRTHARWRRTGSPRRNSGSRSWWRRARPTRRWPG